MGVQQPNSTNYQHPHEPNLLDLDVSLTASVSGTAATCAYSLILIQNGL